MRMSPSLSHCLELCREALQKTLAAACISQTCRDTVQGPLTRIIQNTTRKQTEAEESLLGTVKFPVDLSSSQGPT